MVHQFPEDVCPAGTFTISPIIELPENLPQSFSYVGLSVQIKLCYRFMAQVVPVDTKDVIDEFGKSRFFCESEVSIYPNRPVIVAPTFNNQLSFVKVCGLIAANTCNATISVPKSFYNAGELAYFQIDIDNSLVSAHCDLLVTQECEY